MFGKITKPREPRFDDMYSTVTSLLNVLTTQCRLVNQSKVIRLYYRQSNVGMNLQYRLTLHIGKQTSQLTVFYYLILRPPYSHKSTIQIHLT